MDELSFLAKLARKYITQDPGKFHVPEGFSLDRFCSLSRAHHVSVALLPLIDLDDRTTAEEIRQAGDRVKLDGRHTVVMMMELERVFPVLEEAGCRPVILKGGALAANVYHRPEHRFMIDLDILVPRDRVRKACEEMAGLGYGFAETGKDPGFYEDHHFHWILRDRRGFTVEIHWALTLPSSYLDFDLDGLWERARTSSYSGVFLRIPGPRDMILHSALQAAAGGFRDFRILLDVALLWEQLEDHEGLVQQAIRQHQQYALWLLLTQMEEWLGVAVPVEFLDRLRPGTALGGMLRKVAHRSLVQVGHSHGRGNLEWLLHLLCVPGQVLRLRELKRFLFRGEAGYLELGYKKGAMPGPGKRAWLFMERLRILLGFPLDLLAGDSRQPEGPD